jgi:3'-5' exonuclease
MEWKSKVLNKTDQRTAKVSQIGSPNAKKYIEIEFDNQDVAQVAAKDWKFDVGQEVSYKIETKQWSNGDNSFDTNTLVEFGEPTSTGGVTRKPIKALDGYHAKKMLYLDIECVRQFDVLEEGTPEFESWAYKRRKYNEETTVEQLQASYKAEAALFSEFAKVVCVSIGRIDKGNKILLQSFYSHNEAELLQQVGAALDAFASKGFALAGHGVKGYDVPFMMRRMLINRVAIPDCLDVAGAKPWEVRIIDSNELWKSTGFYSASLLNVATAMGLPSPKSNLDGSKVSDAYYSGEDGIVEIARYCEQDVITVVNILLCMFGLDFIFNVESRTFPKVEVVEEQPKTTKKNGTKTKGKK